MNKLLDQAGKLLTDGADGSIFLPGEATRSSRPSEEEIQAAQSRLAEIFGGENLAASDAQFRRGMQDVAHNRSDTDDAKFYIACEGLLGVAGYAHDWHR